MPKYRLLTAEELRGLEKQFVHFLAINGISSDYWEKLKSTDPSRIESLKEEFSDLILESTINDVDILEHRVKHAITFYYHENGILKFIRLELNKNLAIDLSDEFEIETLIRIVSDNAGKINIYKGEKRNSEEKNTEFFHLLESGNKISKNEGLFKYLLDLAIYK